MLRQLDRVLASPVFRNSKRYPALLKFIVEETVEGRGDLLKERVLGVEVFGRAPDYDTSSDHVVRTAAGEVRKRLAQYYMDAGRDDEILIEVPSGSYVPQFRLASENLSAREIIAMSVAAPVVVIPVKSHWTWRDSKPQLIGSLVINAILVAVLILSMHPWGAESSALQKFWDPVFASGSPVLICVGLQDGAFHGSGSPDGSTPPPPPASDSNADPLAHRVAMADLLTLARVANYSGERHAQYHILDPLSTSFTDLQNEPTILIGAGNNNWTRRIANPLRFSFKMGSTNHPEAILDAQNPGRKDWLRRNDPATESSKDYAIISRLLDPRLEQVVVIVGGLGAHGTEVAGQFITNPDQIKKLEAYAPSGWANKNLQVVLSTEVIKGSSGPPKIEAAYFW